jgi:hypothetical protein
MSLEKSTFDRVGGGVNGSQRFTVGPQASASIRLRWFTNTPPDAF